MNVHGRVCLSMSNWYATKTNGLLGPLGASWLHKAALCLRRVCLHVCLHVIVLTNVLAFGVQFGYAFKDEVALFEVAHRPNDDLPALRSVEYMPIGFGTDLHSFVLVHLYVVVCSRSQTLLLFNLKWQQ